MPAIFSRSMRRGNALERLTSAILFALTFSVAGCAVPPSTPANIILNDPHSNGDSLAFSRDSTQLASGDSEGLIWLWQTPDAKALVHWQAHNGPVQGLAYIRNDRVLFSAGYDGAIAKWGLDSQLLVRRQTAAPITDIALDEAGDLLVTGHTDGSVRTWRLSDLSPQHVWQRHRGEVHAVAYHAGTRRFASSSTRVFVWRADETPQELPAPPTDAREIKFSPDGQWLTGGGWFKLFQWRLLDRSLAVLPTEHRGIIKSIDYSADGKTLASISRQTDSAVHFLDPATGAVQRRFQPHDLCGVRLRLSPNGRYLASTADDASVRLWDLHNPLPDQTTYLQDTDKVLR